MIFILYIYMTLHPRSCAEIKVNAPADCGLLKRYEGKKQCGPPCPDRHDISLFMDATLAVPQSRGLRGIMLHEPREITSKSALAGSFATSAAISAASVESHFQRSASMSIAVPRPGYLQWVVVILCKRALQHELSLVAKLVNFDWSSEVRTPCASRCFCTCWKHATRPLIFFLLATIKQLSSGSEYAVWWYPCPASVV